MEAPMAVTTIPSRDFNQDVTAAKRAAEKGPVIITDRGRPAYVLLSIDRYRQLANKSGKSMVDLLSQPEGADIEFDPPRLGGEFPRPADLD
jgi:PHD/YefM family antitoxin component YafN of YafNO toxin-antitoxin module